ncbi:MAG: hypothetical protein ACOYOJ_16080 [Alsobacter sp.]
MTPWTFLAAAGSVLIFAGGPAALALAPRTGQPVAILMTGRDDSASVLHGIGRSGGQVLDMRGSRVVFAVSPDSDFTDRLRREGLWLVVDAAGLGACMPSPARELP